MATLKEVLAEAQKNDRICPLPDKWNRLYRMLPKQRGKDGKRDPALPLILAAWWGTSGLQKMQRLREHIEWADAHGCLDKAYALLRSLPEEEWHHFRD